MPKSLWIVFAILTAGCAAQSYSNLPATPSAPPERTGPQISAHEAADWSRLNTVGSIEIAKLNYSEMSTLKDKPEDSLEKIELKFFPQQKSITFEIVPVGNASLRCQERGQSFGLMFLASPGADVSDQLNCTGENFTRHQLSMNYRTTSNWKDDTLTIDGSARLRSVDDRNDWEDYVVELHGAIQVSGTTCRVLTWRETFPGTGTVLNDPTRWNRSLASAPDTTCKLKKVGAA